MSSEKKNLETIYSILDVYKSIIKGHTGGLKTFSEKLKMSEATLWRRMESLRDLGAEIDYDNIQCTYYFVNNFSMVFEIKAR